MSWISDATASPFSSKKEGGGGSCRSSACTSLFVEPKALRRRSASGSEKSISISISGRISETGS